VTALAASPILAPEPPPRSARFWRLVGLSVLAHIVLFAILSLTLLNPPEPPPPPPQTMEVTIADDVGLKAAAPQNLTPPAQSRAPVIDKPEEAAAAAPAETQPEPSPPKPQPEAAPPPKPAPVAKPQPKKVAPPAPKKVAKAQPKPAPAAPAKPVKAPGKAVGTASKSTKPRASGASLGDIMKGISPEKSTSTSVTPKAAAMSQQALMDIGQKIKQRVQPCANRQVNPAPGYAEAITVIVNLKINRDGSLNGRPRVIGHRGVTDNNKRYQSAVDDRAIATFMGCSPLTGLPPELYAVPRGWSDFNTTFKLPG
jgi:outer membrane biosynthesis protein TonB